MPFSSPLLTIVAAYFLIRLLFGRVAPLFTLLLSDSNQGSNEEDVPIERSSNVGDQLTSYEVKALNEGGYGCPDCQRSHLSPQPGPVPVRDDGLVMDRYSCPVCLSVFDCLRTGLSVDETYYKYVERRTDRFRPRLVHSAPPKPRFAIAVPTPGDDGNDAA